MEGECSGMLYQKSRGDLFDTRDWLSIRAHFSCGRVICVPLCPSRKRRERLVQTNRRSSKRPSPASLLQNLRQVLASLLFSLSSELQSEKGLGLLAIR